MSNDAVYAAGVLNRALDPSTQPPEIRAFMQAELDVLFRVIADGMSWLDVGCGTGRHLGLLQDRVAAGVGIDYEQSYVAEARRRFTSRRLLFVAADATRLPFVARFDFATCLTNTWGTMTDKRGVLAEMRRCVPHEGMRLISVFAESSVPARRDWYSHFGHPVVEASAEFLVTEGGLRSEHFSEDRLRSIVGDCTIHECAGIGYIARF
jgi:ubiquinone/menaquinone biosynthesis C-methylase UbiE